jgi:hypothetical protein
LASEHFPPDLWFKVALGERASQLNLAAASSETIDPTDSPVSVLL